MPPAIFRPAAKPLSGRYLSLTEREDIALLLVQGHRADSTGRRNRAFVDLCEAVVKRLGGGLPAKRLARAGIEGGRYGSDGVGAVGA